MTDERGWGGWRRAVAPIAQDWRDAMDRLSTRGGEGWRALATRAVVFAVVGGAVIALLEPTATAAAAYPAAAAFWMLHMLAAAALMAGIATLVVVVGLPMPLPLLIAVVALPWLLAGPSLLIDLLVGDPSPDEAGREGLDIYLGEVGDLAGKALGLAALTIALTLRSIAAAHRLRAALRARIASEPSLLGLLPDLPPHVGDDIVRVEAQDHYVLIVTTEGQATLSRPFSKIVATLSPLRGKQCHRSHWVRERHLVRVVRAGSAYRGHLSNGDTIPISRRRRADLIR